jgi:hypothetical protein
MNFAWAGKHSEDFMFAIYFIQIFFHWAYTAPQDLEELGPLWVEH